MAGPVALRIEISAVVRVGRQLVRHPLGDGEAFRFERADLFGVVGHQADRPHAQQGAERLFIAGSAAGAYRADMLVRLPSLMLVRLLAALLLATIGLQASASAPPSLEKTSGSAFSAATYEVALYVQRGGKVQRQAVAPQPLVPLPTVLRTLPVHAAAPAVRFAPRPASTGPPLRPIRAWKPAPRAPPRA